MDRLTKYPRTPHLPWSPGASSDDVWCDLDAFRGREVVVTEKMDGENTTLYREAIHARSLDSRHHPSRSWVKALQHRIGHTIPPGWRVCGENMYARHALGYEGLASYLLAFSIWDATNTALDWDQTIEWCALLGLEPVRTLWRGAFDEAALRALPIDTTTQEGFVLRLADRIPFEAFSRSVAKWVREGHVQEGEEHWMYQPVVPNTLRTDAEGGSLDPS